MYVCVYACVGRFCVCVCVHSMCSKYSESFVDVVAFRKACFIKGMFQAREGVLSRMWPQFN